jgi:hypothetical protein
VLSTLSIVGNIRRVDARSVLTFPDFTTPLLGLAVFVVVFRWHATRLDRAAAGRAGRQATFVAAVLFGLVLGAFTWYRLPSRSVDLALYTTVTSFVGALILGFIGSLLCARRASR